MRFVAVIVLLALLALAGLFIYGQMLEPETHTIEQEALRVSGA